MYEGGKQVDKKPLIGISIIAVILLVLGSLTNVVGYQSVKSSGISESIAKMQIGPGDVNWTVNGTMGKNGCYISPITLTCTYDHDWIAGVYYKYNDSGYELYTDPFTIYEQGQINFVWYFVDYQGYVSPIHGPYHFRIDYTPPVITLTVKKIGFMKWLFSAMAYDDISGLDNVEFYLDGLFLGNVTSAPYEWIWIGSGNHTVLAIAYDFAGLNASSSMSTPYNLRHFQSNLHHQQIIRIFQNLILYHQTLFGQIWN